MKPVFVIFISVLLSGPLYAVTDQEKSLLLALSEELKTISFIIDEAEQAVDINHRRQVNYRELRDDFELIRQGIEDAINEERREIQSLPELEADYR